MIGRGRAGRLWAPWRIGYIRASESEARRRAAKKPARRRSGSPGTRRDCLFCRLSDDRNDRANLVLARRPQAFLMLNRFPYNPAHLMVAVRRHAGQFRDLDAEESRDLLELVALAESVLAAEYRPDGINYGANVGRVAGAGYPGHLHLHLVPRWNGDTNFMPTIAETKVLPESLAQSWSRLRRALRALSTPARGKRRQSARG